MAGNPTGAMGVPDYLGLGLEVEGRPPDRVRARLPGPPGQPVRDDPVPALPGDRPGADDPARRGACARTWLFGATGARGLRPGRLLRAGRLRHRVRLAEVHRRSSAAGARWSSATCPSGAGSTASAAARTSAASASAARCPASRQVHAVHGRAARRAGLDRGQQACTARPSARCAASPQKTVDEEPKWRTPGSELLTGYQGQWR